MNPAQLLGWISLLNRSVKALVWALNPNKSLPQEWKSHPHRCPYLEAKRKVAPPED